MTARLVNTTGNSWQINLCFVAGHVRHPKTTYAPLIEISSTPRIDGNSRGFDWPAPVAEETFQFFDHKPPAPAMMSDVLAGMSRQPKQIPPKYFYNKKGSELFDSITHLPEYYLTRAEMEILHTHRSSIVNEIGPSSCLIEFGSGSSQKIRQLLHVLKPSIYVPIDISKEHLLRASRAIHDDFPMMAVYPVCADFSVPINLPDQVLGTRKTAFFPGSSIGNFERQDAAAFLKTVGRLIEHDGCLLLGVDKRKSPDVLNSAYNDEAGVTAAFNLNLLNHINQSIGSNFDVHAFEHFAEYDEGLGRIQMHLVSQKQQRVQINGQAIQFEENERIHTENSYKYSEDELYELARSGNMECSCVWEDSKELFMVALLRPRI